MSVAAEIKKRLIGAFETALFIPSGIERFPARRVKPLSLLPLV